MGLSKEEVLQKVEAAPEAKFVIRTEEEERTFLDNYRESEVKKEVDPRVSEIYSRLDADILEVTGVRRNPTEKTYEYAKRVLGDANSKIKVFEQKIQELSSTGNPKHDEKIKELESVIERIKEEKHKEIESLTKEKISFRTKSEIDKALAALQQDPSIPDAARQALVESRVNSLMGQAEWDGDKLVFKKDGEVRRNKQSFEVLSAADILKDELASILKVERRLPGAPIAPDASKAKGVAVLPAHITTKVQLTEYLLSQGLKRSSKEYIEAYALGADLPLQ
jgi:hypothetical protein